MKTERVELNSDCCFELTKYDNGSVSLTLDYIEHATDYWSRDTETSIDIDADTASKIVNILQRAYDLFSTQ